MKTIVLVSAGIVASGAVLMAQSPTNGLPLAANVPSFMPMHISGPHAGKRACPLCVYGNRPQVQIWAQEAEVSRAIALTKSLERSLGKTAQCYIVLVPKQGQRPAESTTRLLSKTEFSGAFATYVPSWIDKETSGLYNHTDAQKPNLRVYCVVNRRLYARMDNPGSSQVAQIAAKVKESARFQASHEVTDSQIAPPWEQGQKLRVMFEIFDKLGKPVKNIKVTAWQTDRSGLYNPREFGHIAPRLQCVAWTDARGQIAYETIFPGPYPDQPEPSHIHFAISKNGKNQWRTLWFEGDPMLTPAKRKWEAQNEETLIIPVDRSNAIWKTSHRYILQ